MPDYLAYLWAWFWELSSRRKSGMGGPEPISYADIAHWAALTCSDPTPQEVGVLVAIDMAYLAAIADEHSEAKETQQPARLAKPPE